MIVSIHQPQYLPWLGYFDKIKRSDIFVFLDNVQFKKNEWQNRNKIKTDKKWQWLTVPIIHKFPQKINEVKINNTVSWRKKHLNALYNHYSKAKYFKKFIPFFDKTFNMEWENLVDINIYMITYLTEALGIRLKKFIKASELKLREESTERLIDICKQLNADTYLSGKNGANYMNTELFKKEDLEIIYQKYQHPVYCQLYEGFEPFMSVVDLLFNCGPDSLSVLESRN
jgi:hypothetical protein